MDWRREDSAYAAATLVAAAFVGYLVAGNFGLVRSPFGPADVGASPAQIPAIAAARRAVDFTIPTPAPATAAPSPASSAAPAPALGLTDGSPPAVTITPPATAEVTMTEGSEVSGRATDAGSGVDHVVAVFEPSIGDPVTVPARVSCVDASRTRCTWTADAPGLAGSYTVTAHAADRAGNAGRSEPVKYSVVNVGRLVEDLIGDEPLAEDGPLVTLLGGLLR